MMDRIAWQELPAPSSYIEALDPRMGRTTLSGRGGKGLRTYGECDTGFVFQVVSG